MPTLWRLYNTPSSQTAASQYFTVTQPATVASVWRDIYASQTQTSSNWTWTGLDAASARTASTTAYTSIYHDLADNIYFTESAVDDAFYWQLARNRVAISTTRRVEITRIQESARRQQQELYEQQSRDIRLARERSRELLLAHLTPRQCLTFLANGWFTVHGGKSDTKYRIRTDRISANIEVYEGDQITHRLCGHLPGNLPHFDHILAQKVSLELDEEAFVRLCNRHAA